MRQCTSCKYNNSPDSSFCSKCGLPISNICSSCKHNNPQNSNFCSKCGLDFSKKLKNPKVRNTINTQQKSHDKNEDLISKFQIFLKSLGNSKYFNQINGIFTRIIGNSIFLASLISSGVFITILLLGGIIGAFVWFYFVFVYFGFFWGIIHAFLLFPITVVWFPFYAIIKYGNWIPFIMEFTPLLIIFGHGILASIFNIMLRMLKINSK